MDLSCITPGQSLEGIESGSIVRVVAVLPLGNGPVQVIYRLPDGTLRERLLSPGEEGSISLATASRPWSFEGDGDTFKLAVEAKRIDLAFDIPGELFENKSLKEMLLDAIRYNDQPEVRARLSQSIDNALDVDHIRSLRERNALAQETMSPKRLFAVKEQMEMAEARRLQPYFVRSFFTKAFDSLGGALVVPIGLLQKLRDPSSFIPHPFKEEPGWGVSSVNFDLKALLELSTKP